MKKLFIYSLPLIAIASIAIAGPGIDWNQLYEQKTMVTLEEVNEKFVELKEELEGAKLTASQKNALENLENSFSPKTIPASIKLSYSKGPKWQSKAIEIIDEEHDIHETVSYLGESGYGPIFDYCGFYDDPSLDSYEEIEFVENELGEYWKWRWNSVKSLKSDKSIAYVAFLIVPLIGKDAETRETKVCDYPRSSYGFEAKLLDGKPVSISTDDLNDHLMK